MYFIHNWSACLYEWLYEKLSYLKNIKKMWQLTLKHKTNILYIHKFERVLQDLLVHLLYINMWLEELFLRISETNNETFKKEHLRFSIIVLPVMIMMMITVLILYLLNYSKIIIKKKVDWILESKNIYLNCIEKVLNNFFVRSINN